MNRINVSSKPSVGSHNQTRTCRLVPLTGIPNARQRHGPSGPPQCIGSAFEAVKKKSGVCSCYNGLTRKRHDHKLVLVRAIACQGLEIWLAFVDEPVAGYGRNPWQVRSICALRSYSTSISRIISLIFCFVFSSIFPSFFINLSLSTVRI